MAAKMEDSTRGSGDSSVSSSNMTEIPTVAQIIERQAASSESSAAGGETGPPGSLHHPGFALFKQGAEARLYRGTFLGRPTVLKERFSKKYRHPRLDEKLTTKRTQGEARTVARARKAGIPTPCIYFVNYQSNCIYMEDLRCATTSRDYIVAVQSVGAGDSFRALQPIMDKIGKILATMHDGDIIHGDLTTSNIMLKQDASATDPEVVLIDFGLSSVSQLAEDKGVDLYVLEKAFLSTHPNTETLFRVILKSYTKHSRKSKDVIKKLDEVRLRGRKRTMVG
ncbi:TP53RK [Branchiostoma lanceolatum]|uniref:non-specific serine/threonine protein kinase n=1 Tax=Branchiostoma lanceolatum TaxID=7740 RepID=A0A8K0A4C8_BRALA|nr:TP53RK [Branchiostoma lanceolatum]